MDSKNLLSITRNQVINSTFMLIFSALVCHYFGLFPTQLSSMCSKINITIIIINKNIIVQQEVQAQSKYRQKKRESIQNVNQIIYSTLMLIFSALVSCYSVLFPRRPSSLCVAISSSVFNNKAQARIKWRPEQKERAFRT